MTYKRDLASLQAANGTPADLDDSHTVRGLLRLCRGWLTGEVTAQAIHDPCLQMAGRLREAAEATFRDLDNNPDMCDEARDPVLDTGEAYEAIAELLDEMPGLAAANKRQEYQEALVDFEAERLVVLDASEEINAQMSGDERRCPKCGQGQEEGKERCPDCRLTLLYPDPKGLIDYSHKSAHLSTMHLNIYNAYRAVVDGERSVETLLKTLPPYAAHLAELTRFCDGQEEGGESPELVYSLRVDIATGVAGVARLQAVASTHKTSDLNRGWEDIFESSVSVQSDLRRWGETEGLVEPEQSAPHDGLELGPR